MSEYRQNIQGDIDRYSTKVIAENKITKMGLPMPPKPPDAQGDANIFDEWEGVKSSYGGMANIPFNVLGDFLDRWTGLTVYARWVESVADIDQATAREIKETVKKRLYAVQEGSREIKDAKVFTEEIYNEWHFKYTEKLTSYITIKALREGYELRMNAISREITRRLGDVSDIRRATNRGNGA